MFYSFGHNRLTVDTTLCQFILSFTLAGPGSHSRCGGTQSRGSTAPADNAPSPAPAGPY